MEKALKISIIIVVIAGLAVGGYFVYQKYFTDEKEATTTETTEEVQKLSLDPDKINTHLSKIAGTKGVYWMRGGFDLTWGNVETKKGTFDWSMIDENVKQFSKEETYLVPIVKPFANWDQEKCHADSRYDADYGPEKGGKLKVGKPCDMKAYASFLEKAVERYDGDGEDDMPGLTIPIKYWEIMNEPSMQGGSTGGMGEELKFFVGTSDEYFEILKTSYQAIKKVDPESKVLPGGMAGMQSDFTDFWTPIFDKGASKYFDIANMHTINTDERRHDSYVIKFKEFLKKYKVNKPIWITELQYGELATEPADLASFETLMVKNSVFTLAMGADKLFYIENWLHWDNPFGEKPEEGPKDKKDEKEKDTYLKEATKTSTHKVYLNLVAKINSFNKIVAIKEDYYENQNEHDGTTSTIGQYKFVSDEGNVYVLWGEAAVPTEIKGKIKVTDIYGDSENMDASKLDLSDTPVFVEIL
ncbi:hypothetical protein ACFL24_00195 [Patescibacteria group bacterium]